MKMKKACEATGLTERAIRLYLSKNLIAPKQINGILDFSSDDILYLKDIALLRQFDFSIEQISSMIHHPATITEIIRYRIDLAQSDVEHNDEVRAVLGKIAGETVEGFHSFADQIRASGVSVPEPNFGRFDEISEEERQHEKTAALIQLAKGEKRTQRIRRIATIACILSAIILLAVLYLTHPRVQGYIPFGSFTVTELRSDTISVVIHDDRVAEVLGCDSITVPYRAYRVPLAVGDTIEGGCQLAVDITNYDLLRIGINPLQTIQTKSEEINREWMYLVVRSLFEHTLHDEATLWIREYNPQQFPPLFRWETE